jgi:hypothetical protein
MAGRIKAPSPALVVAMIALFVSIGGVGYAASKIDTNDIKREAVTKPKIAKKAVSANRIAENAVKTKKIRDQAVTTDKIADQAVNTDKIGDLAVTTPKILDQAVTTGKIADDAVTGDKVLNDSLTGDKIDESTLGTVPSANNANALGGIGPSGYAPRIFARVQYNDATPSIIASSPGITASGEGALGFPRVTFPQVMDNCAIVAGATSGAGTQILRRSNSAGALVQFAIKNENGAAVRSNFDLVAVC